MNYEKGNFTIVPNLGTLAGLRPLLQSVYLQLCFMADSQGVCWPKHATIASRAGCSVSGVKTALNELVEAELLAVQNRMGKNGQQSNVYLIQVATRKLPSQPPESYRTISTKNYNQTTNTNVLVEPVAEEPEQLNNPSNDQAKFGLTQTSIDDSVLPADDILTTGIPNKQRGDPAINEVISFFEGQFELKLKNVQKQRFAAKRLIDRYTQQTVDQAIKAAALVRNEEYAPMILNLEDLWYKWDKLAAFYRRKQKEQSQDVAIITED